MCVLLPSGETRNYISVQKEWSRLRDRSKGSKTTKKRPCDTTDPETSKAALRKPKTQKRAPQDQPTTSRSEAVTQTVEQEDTLSSSSSDEVLQPGLFG